MELFCMPQLWIRLFEVAHDWMKLLHTAKFDLADGLYQARNQGGAGEAKPP